MVRFPLEDPTERTSSLPIFLRAQFISDFAKSLRETEKSLGSI